MKNRKNVQLDSIESNVCWRKRGRLMSSHGTTHISMRSMSTVCISSILLAIALHCACICVMPLSRMIYNMRVVNKWGKKHGGHRIKINTELFMISVLVLARLLPVIVHISRSRNKPKTKIWIFDTNDRMCVCERAPYTFYQQLQTPWIYRYFWTIRPSHRAHFQVRACHIFRCDDLSLLHM